MQDCKTQTFEHDGKRYETRISNNGLIYEVRVFNDAGKPANGYRYVLEVLTQLDALRTESSINPLNSLIQAARSHVENGTWEQYLAAVEASSLGNP